MTHDLILTGGRVIDPSQNIDRITEFVASLSSRQPLAESVTPGSPTPGALSPETLPPIDSVLSPVPPSRLTATDTVAYLAPRHSSAEALRETLQAVVGQSARSVLIEGENRIAVIGDAAGSP